MMPAPARKNASTRKIVLVGPAAPYRGGIAHFLHATYHGLVARGHQVDVVNFSRQYPSLLFPGKTQYESDVADPIPSRRLLDSINPVSWFRTARAITAGNPDVVVFMHWMPFFAPAYGTIARRLKARGIRVLSIVHNALPHERRPGDIALSRYFFKACDGGIVMSDAVQQDLASLHNAMETIQVRHPVYNHFGEGIERTTARQQLGISPNTPMLLFFGFVRKYKGLQVLLESMTRVRNALPAVKLVVAGECYDDAGAYQAYVGKHKLADHVQLLFKYIPEGEISPLFSAADVIVQPYITATQSGVAQIAYHFERPLIVTDVGGLAEIVPHERAGLVVPPSDPDALAAAIVRFFKENLYTQLHQGVLEEKQLYSWDRLFEAIESLVA